MSKKYISFAVFLSVFLVLPFFVSGQTAGGLQRGAVSEGVRNLQNILRSDPSIYPEGLATGYYGPATESAVRRLQAKYGLPQTGIVDSATLQVMFPTNVKIKVLSPNGGESWDKSASHLILWQVTIDPVIVNGRETAVRPFFSNVSIDLTKDYYPDFAPFRYHIGTADLYQTQFVWQIPSNIQNSSDYRITISVGGPVPCLQTSAGAGGSSAIPCPLYFPQYSFSDSSDNPFSITGTTYLNDRIAKIYALLDQIQQEINALQSELNSIRQLLSGL